MAPVAPRAAPHNPPQSAPQRALQLDQQSTMDLTLTVLQRMDPAVAEILLTVGHVTVYEFDVAASSWVRTWLRARLPCCCSVARALATVKLRRCSAVVII
ncbi:unnamed protein product [Closterium sp. NIES-53]